MSQRYGVEQSTFDVSGVSNYLQRQRAANAANKQQTEHIIIGREDFAKHNIPEDSNHDYYQRNVKTGHISPFSMGKEEKEKTKHIFPTDPEFPEIAKNNFGLDEKGIQELKDSGKFIQQKADGTWQISKIKDPAKTTYRNPTEQEIADLGLKISTGDLVQISSEGKVNVVSGSGEQNIAYYQSGDKEFDDNVKKLGLTVDHYLQKDIKTGKLTPVLKKSVEREEQAEKKRLEQKPKDKFYKDQYGAIDYKWNPDTQKWEEGEFTKSTGGRAMEGRLENFIVELNRKDQNDNYVHDSKYHRSIRDKLQNVYGSVNPDYIADAQADIDARVSPDLQSDKFKINTEYATNIDESLKRYRLHTDKNGVMSIKYEPTRSEQIAQAEPLENYTNILRQVDKFVWTAKQKAVWEDKGTPQDPRDLGDDEAGDTQKFILEWNANENQYNFVANPEYIKHKKKLDSTEQAIMQSLNEEIDESLNRLSDIAPDIYNRLQRAGGQGMATVQQSVANTVLSKIRQQTTR